MKTILGLDMGTNSLGWTLIKWSKDKSLGEIIAKGARIFEPPIVKETKVPKNRKRREARGARRVLFRRKTRRRDLLNTLVQHRLLPEDEDERNKLVDRLDPYCLRSRGLDEKLEPFEFGRALRHLGQRRGFKSNRKVDKKDKDTGKVKDGISDLENKIKENNARTLGEYLYKHCGSQQKRNRYTSRKMYMDEFDQLWSSQARFHQSLTNELKRKFYEIIFFQNPLKSQKYLVGLCRHERYMVKNEEGKDVMIRGNKRCLKSHPLFQRFRTLQEIANLQINGKPLTDEQRELLLKKSETCQAITWKAMRKILGINETDHINMDQPKSKGLPGAMTWMKLMKAIGKKKWAEFAPATREDIFVSRATIENEEAFVKRAGAIWNLSSEEAGKVWKVDLEAGYASLSLRAVKKLIPHMERGLAYATAVKEVYGDDSQDGQHSSLPEPPNVRNPTVQMALHETRKLVNSIIRKYGKPDIIRVELARDMKSSKKERERVENDQAKRQKENEKIKKIISGAPFNLPSPNKGDIMKYRLWEDSGNVCVYSGEPIPASILFTENVEVDHILPFKRSANDSYMNKAICYTKENRYKGNQTPREAFSSEKWEKFEKRVNSAPALKKKARYLLADEIADDLPLRHLNDTRYMSKEAKKYLENLEGVKVQATKGTLTAMLRRLWGLNSVLPTSAKDAEIKERIDHRHHAIDAVVIALTGPGVVSKLTMVNLWHGRIDHKAFPDPWPGFRNEVEEKAANIIVSHRVTRKVRGALHEETIYGLTDGKAEFTCRKEIRKLTLSEIKKIRNPAIMEMILAKLGLTLPEIEEIRDPKEKKKILAKLHDSSFHLPNRHGAPVPIKKVRLLLRKSPESVHTLKGPGGEPRGAVAYGHNHHMEIIRNRKTGKYEGRVVTRMEAARRTRREKLPAVQRDHGPEWEFVMSLAINEIVKLTLDGKEEYYRVQVLDGKSTNITFRKHWSADIKNDTTRLFKNPNTLMALNPVKVTVSRLGEVYPAND